MLKTRILTATYLTAALLLCPLGLKAKEAEDANAEEKAASAQLKLAIEMGAPFMDNAILQREMEVPVWGWSKPGTTITSWYSIPTSMKPCSLIAVMIRWN